MFLVTVTPITKEPLKENLSYFTRKEVRLGAIVQVPVRSRTLRALVVSCTSVLHNKSALKESPFPIKKIEAVAEGTVFSPAFVEAITKAADYYATFPGNLLRAYIPEEILEKWTGLSGDFPTRSGIYEPLILQAPLEERIATYRAMIREEFAKKNSIMIIVPSRILIEDLREGLTKGIEEYLVVLHGDLSKKELLAEWKRGAETEHPVLIITTPGALALPRRDLGAIVVEHESASGYKNMFRPLVDLRIVARFMAQTLRTRLVYADTLLSVEAMSHKELDGYHGLTPPKHRLTSTGETTLVDMRERKDPKADPFFSDEMLRAVREGLEHKGRVFLFTVRKGLAPLTICSDCGTTLACPVCTRPLALFSAEATRERPGIENIYACTSCEQEYPTDIRCNVCNSWRLTPLGIGTEKVVEQLGQYFQGTPVFVIDSEHVKSHKQGLLVRDEFLSTKGAILVGTEMALSYLPTVTTAGVVAIDNVLAIPDYHMNEKIMHLIVAMREKTEGSLVIQTRKPDLKVFHHAARGTLLDFYREEMETRKKYRYPPHARFIKISREGKSAEVNADVALLETELAPWNPEVFSGLYTPGPGEELVHILLRLPPKEWPNPTLLALLRKLPHRFVIDIDPEELL